MMSTKGIQSNQGYPLFDFRVFLFLFFWGIVTFGYNTTGSVSTGISIAGVGVAGAESGIQEANGLAETATAVFSDDFNDSSFTAANWVQLGDAAWNTVALDNTNYGYQNFTGRTGKNDPVPEGVSFANSATSYKIAGLKIKARFRIDTSETTWHHAGIILSADENLTVGYSAGIEFDLEGPEFEFQMELGARSGEFNETASPIAVDIPEPSLNTFYILEVTIDSDETMSVLLYGASSDVILGSISGIKPILPIHSGKVGIMTGSAATFDSFSLEGSESIQIGKDPGTSDESKPPSSEIDLILNITATDTSGNVIDPATIAQEWLFIAPTIGGVNLGLILLTDNGLQDYDDVSAIDPSLSSATLTFDHTTGDTISLGVYSLEDDLGMVSDDWLMYGYAYTLTDINDVVIENVVTLNIQ